MADEIAYKIVVESDLADKSVGQLKQDFKDLTDQLNKTKIGTEEYKKTLSSLGVVKGGIQELKQQIQALNPEKTIAAFAKVGSTVASGFAAGQAVVALFGGESEDLMKVLVKVQAATALASGLQGLSGMTKALQTAGLAMKAFALSNPFTAIALGVTTLVAAIYGLSKVFDTEEEKADARHKKVIDNAVEASQAVANRYDVEIKYAKAAGKETFELERKKQDAILETLKIQAKEIYLSAIKEKRALTEEELKLINDIKEKAIDAYTQKNLANINEVVSNKKKLDDIAKDNKAATDKEKADLLAWQQEKNDVNVQAHEDNVTKAKEEQDAIDAMNLANSLLTTEVLSKDSKDVEQRAKDEIALANLVYNTKVQLAAQSLSAIADLATAFAGKNEKSAKRAFEINKALSIASAIVSTYQGANAIFANAAANPTTVLFPAQPFITAGIAIVSGLANVAKIAKTQFNGGTPSGEGGTGAPNLGGGGSSAEPPQFKQPEGTGLNKDGEGDFNSFQKTQQPMKVYVLETDISEVQKKVSVIEQNATY